MGTGMGMGMGMGTGMGTGTAVVDSWQGPELHSGCQAKARWIY